MTTQNDVIKVLSGKSLATMTEEGGCGHWKLSRTRAASCGYVVVVRNMNAEWSEEGTPHHTAFLIGKISGVLDKDQRHIIQFSEYADIFIPDSWDGSRNPVAYTSLKSLNIDVGGLTWKPYPGAPKTSQEKRSSIQQAKGLNFQQAKIELAATYGVHPDQIEITIKA